MAKITPEQYEQWLAENRPEITVLEPYVSSETKIMHQCDQGHEPWSVKPNNIKNGNGCPRCADEAAGRHPSGYWTLERCKDDAQLYRSRKEWEKGSGSAYATARRRGWLEECTAHMERKRESWTDAKLIADAKKYKTAREWQLASGSAYAISASRGAEFHARACAHMEQGNSASDFDAVYVWEVIDALGPTGIYKVGLTSRKLNDQRIKDVARKGGFDYRLVALCQTSDGDARGFEDFIKGLGTPFTDVPDTFDGKTELRTFSPEAMDSIYQLLGVKGARAEATQGS